MTQEKVRVLTCKRTLELFIPEPIHGDQDVHLNLSLGRPSWESNTGWNWNFESVHLQNQKPPQYIITNDKTTSLATTTDLSETHELSLKTIQLNNVKRRMKTNVSQNMKKKEIESVVKR